MRLRFGIALLGVFALTAGGCAAPAASGGGGASPGFSVDPALAENEEPEANNSQTQAAERALGMAMLASGDAAMQQYQTALDNALQAVATDARNPLPWLQAGHAYVGLKDLVGADTAYARALELRPYSYAAEIDNARYNAWANTLNEAGAHMGAGPAEYVDALDDLELANVIYDRPETWYYQGQIQNDLGSFEESVASLRRSQEIMDEKIAQVDSVTAEAWRTEIQPGIPQFLADGLLRTGQNQEAIAVLEPLVAANPANVSYARNLANVYYELGRTDEAMGVYRQMVQQAGDDLTVADYMIVATGYYQMEEYDESSPAFEEVLRQAPMNRDAAEWLSRSLRDQLSAIDDAGGEPDPALLQRFADAADKWVELDPNSRTGLTFLLAALGRIDQTNPRVAEVAGAIEDLDVSLDVLEFFPDGQGGQLSGQVYNESLTAGDQVTVTVTFYGPGGGTLGTESQDVTLPGQGAAAQLSVFITTEQEVQGYTYEVQTGN